MKPITMSVVATRVEMERHAMTPSMDTHVLALQVSLAPTVKLKSTSVHLHLA